MSDPISSNSSARPNSNARGGPAINPSGPLRSVAPPSIHHGVHTNANASSNNRNTNVRSTGTAPVFKTPLTSASTSTSTSASTSTSSSTVTVKPQLTRVDPLSQPIPLTTHRPAPPPPVPPLSSSSLPPPPPPSLSLPTKVNTNIKPNGIVNVTQQPIKSNTKTNIKTNLKNTNTHINTNTKQSQLRQRKILTPEQEVDSFLSGPSKRTTVEEEPGPLPLLKPNPLPPNLTGMRQLKALVERRAWGDVFKVSTDMLMGGVSPYAKYYSELVNGVQSQSSVNADTNTNTDADASSNNKSNSNNSNGNGNNQNPLIKETIQIIHWRIRALLFLRRYHDLKTEILRMRLLPSTSYQDSLPDWIPLDLILEGIEATYFVNMNKRGRNVNGGGGGINSASTAGNANIMSMNEDDNRTEREELDAIVDNLYNLRNSDAIANGETFNLLKLDVILVNILTRSEEWRLALHTLDSILGYAEDAVKSWCNRDIGIDSGNGSGSRTGYEDEVKIKMMCKAVKIELYSRQGKIFLQAGALPAAATVFEHAHDLNQTMHFNADANVNVNANVDTDAGTEAITDASRQSEILGNDLLVRNAKTQIFINEGLLHFAHIDYDLAEQKFRIAVECQRECQKDNSVKTHGDLSLEGGGLMDTEGDLLIPCLNNLALCALYSCHMREAISMMEALVREDPTRYLTEVMVFNLCTLYELSADNSNSDRKKRVLQSIAKRFTLHDIGPENFRLH